MGKAHEDGLVRLVIDIYSKIHYTVGTVGNKEQAMTVYIVCFRGTVYGVYDSREKALAGAKAEYGDLYDVEILEKEVK